MRTSSNAVYKKSIKIDASNNSLYLSKIVLKNWDELVQINRIKRIKKIAVTLSDLAIESMQISLFDSKNNPKENKVSKVLDKINEKFEKNAISLGLVKLKKKEETPIAFGYVPDKK